MTNANPPLCPRCSAPMLTDGPDPQCPACLLSGALTTAGRGGDAAAPDPRAASADAAAFPRAFGGYRLLGLLGSGGMGTVYEAEDRATGRCVALKMLDRRLDEPEMRQRFLREGRLAARVSHPNSLYVFGAEEVEDAPVITMEISRGGTLEDRLQKRGPLPIAEAVDAILDAIAGLEAAAAGGVLHRDVKPANCFVGADGSVRVGDYGLSVSTLAREDTLVTAPGSIMGTPAYAPPEQLRGDDLDLRADIYSVGATLFALVTGRPPFEGRNAVEVVAKAVNQDPPSVRELREGVPHGLDAVVARCLAKEPGGRYEDYATLRNALLPFSSREPEPASMLLRVSAGWVDYLIAFLPAYLVLMFTVGAEPLLVQPIVERTLGSFRDYLLLLGIAALYFVVAEGLGGAGVGKALKGLCVIGPEGRRPGLARAFVRFLVPILTVEGIRIPLTMTFITTPEWTGLQTALFVLACVGCGWIPAVLALRARPANGFATLWDRVSGTRVVVRRKGTERPAVEPAAAPEVPPAEATSRGPYEVVREIAPGAWIAAVDPLLRRSVWLLRRPSTEPSRARCDVARPGRLRWLQTVPAADAAWEAYEAPAGRPFGALVARGRRVDWAALRFWLDDLATEIQAAAKDGTLPAALGLDHVWITSAGRAVLLDEPWPEVEAPAEPISVDDLEGQQRFLHAVAASVETARLPLHVRPTLQNLSEGRFERLSFLRGTVRGLLDRPVRVGRALRAGSIFLLPLFVWITIFVGRYHDKPPGEALRGLVFVTALVLLGTAVLHLLEVPFRSTVGHEIFRLAVVDARGRRASAGRVLKRWAFVWLPLLVPTAVVLWLWRDRESVAIAAGLVLLLPWVAATFVAVLHPHRGLHDRWADTWVVRR